VKRGIRRTGTSTRSPVRGLRPTRARRRRAAKVPKLRISTRPPLASCLAMASRITSTANLTSSH